MDTFERESLADLLKWLESRNIVGQSSALVAYDRKQANLLLEQEYIDRYDGVAHMPAIDGYLVDISQDEQVALVGVAYGPPLLSFENSSYQASLCTVRFTAVGGLQINTSKAVYQPGEGRVHYPVTQWRKNDALSGFKYEEQIMLHHYLGQLSEQSVVFSVATGELPASSLLKVSPYLSQQRRAGGYMEELFREMGPDITRFTLNSVEPDPNGFFRPTQFAIRILPEPESADGTGGAVLLSVKAGDDDQVSFPALAPEKFPIPRGFSVSMMLSRNFMLQRIMETSMRAIAAAGAELEPFYDNDGSSFAGMRFTSGHAVVPAQSYDVYVGNEKVTCKVGLQRCKLTADRALPGAAENFNIRFVPASGRVLLRITWGSEAEPTSGSIGVQAMTQTTFWYIAWDYELRLVEGELLLELVEDSQTLKIRTTMALADGGYTKFLSEAVRTFEEKVFIDTVKRSVDDAIKAATGPLNIMHLNELLFRSAEPVALEQLHLANGPVLFGQVSPSRTTFFIDTQGQTRVPAQGKVALSITLTGDREVSDVEWEVESADANYHGEVGGIVDQQGVTAAYQGPGSLVDANMTSVRINAKVCFAGDSTTYHSSTLLYVLANAIQAGPSVQIVNKGLSAHVNVATVVTGEPVTFSIDGAGQALGESIALSNADGYSHVYTAPSAAVDYDPDFPDQEVNIGFLLRRVLFFDQKQANSTDTYFIVTFATPSIAVVVEHEDTNDPGTRQLRIRGWWTEFSEPIHPDENPEWKIEGGEGARQDLPDGTLTYRYSTSVREQYMVVSVKVLDEFQARSAPEPAEDAGQAPTSARRPRPAKPYGVAIVPLPWRALAPETNASTIHFNQKQRIQRQRVGE